MSTAGTPTTTTATPQAAPTTTATLASAGLDPQNPFLNINSKFAEVQGLVQLAASKPMPEALKRKIVGMLLRLDRLLQGSGYSREYETTEQYVRWAVSIPWGQYSEDNLDLKHAEEELNKHHYGLQHVKDMVLEYLSVMQLQRQGQPTAGGKQVETASGAPITADQSSTLPNAAIQAATTAEMSKLRGSSSNAPVLCFVGIQGVGKTSIAKSIANSLGRPFVRIALGAMGDVAQIRGRSLTQPNAEPGYIVKALVNSKVMNPVILLDEIDKTSSETGLRADLMAALLEILDPEQNATFSDHYLDFPVDLSRCIFITTGNNLGGISAALLDRLEIIRFGSYTDEDKINIAKNYMLPKVRRATGIGEDQLTFDDAVWPLVIRPLGFDAGVRQLERTLSILTRKVARLIVEGKGTKFHLTPENFRQFIPEDIGVYS